MLYQLLFLSPIIDLVSRGTGLTHFNMMTILIIQIALNNGFYKVQCVLRPCWHESIFDEGGQLGPVSRTSRGLFRPEKQSACFEKMTF